MTQHVRRRLFSRLLALMSSALLVCAPLVSMASWAQDDDDMPDGDADLVEKPKKKPPPPPKRDPPKKADKKPPPDKPAEKAPPHKPAPEKPEKARPVDGDVLADDDEPQVRAEKPEKTTKEPVSKPDKPDRARPVKPDVLDVDDVILDENTPSKRPADENDPRKNRSSLPEDEPPKKRKSLDDDEPPKRRIAQDVVNEDKKRRTLDDELANENTAGPWIIGGAVGGGLLLLAGAGVGGYFALQALTPHTGTIVVTPR